METKNYELAYLLSPSISEGEILVEAGKLNKLIEDTGGMIRRAEEPRKRRLAYPVKKEINAYFGWTTFNASGEAVVGITKKIKSFADLLRSMVTEEVEIEFRPTVLRTIPSRPAAQRAPRTVTPQEPAAGEEKLDLEALDKRLEEILGK